MKGFAASVASEASAPDARAKGGRAVLARSAARASVLAFMIPSWLRKELGRKGARRDNFSADVSFRDATEAVPILRPSDLDLGRRMVGRNGKSDGSCDGRPVRGIGQHYRAVR